MKKIAIMGARGFVGKNLTEHFQNKYEVYPITRKEVDLLDFESVKHFFEIHEIDAVFNCMNQGGSRKTGYDSASVDVIGNNLKMFFNVEQSIGKQTKMINFGSGAQYDKARNLVKVSEKEIGQKMPKDDYGYSKYVMSKYVSALQSSNVYSPIIFGLYGQYEDYTFKFISNAIVKNLLHMPIVINQNVLFDYLYMGDFLKIMDLIVENEFPEKEFNITPCKSISLVEICNLINEISEYKSEITVRNPGMNYQYTGDNTRLLHNVGDEFTFTPYKEGIQELYQYYSKHLNELELQTIRDDELLKYCKINK